jgi:cytochrome c oxidase assembly protein subunit 15
MPGYTPDICALRRWLRTGLVLVIVMVSVGAITRLTESGLSITDWRPVTGIVPPLSQSDWESEFAKYRNSPEFLYKNTTFTLEDFKTIYWWEWIHRFIARLIGLVYLVPLVYFLVKKKIPGAYLPGILFVGLLGGFQGFLGWYMVKSGLVDEPRVSHYRLAAHLSTALLIASALYWQSLRLTSGPIRYFVPSRALRRLSWLTLTALVIQIIYGAFVAGKDAGQLYNTWPKMGDAWMPEAVYAASPWYMNLLENEAGLQFIHRTWAWVVYVLVVVLSLKLLRDGNYLKKTGFFLLTLIHLQILLGILTLIHAVPITLGVLHQLTAVFLLLGLLRVIHYQSYKA